jgi:hypothetical protein
MWALERILVTTLCALLCASSALAQDQRPEGAARQDLTIVIQRREVRFISQKTDEEMRLQVFDQSGEVAFDSGAVQATEVDWPFQTATGEALKSGLYAYTLSTKEAGAAEARLRRGHFIVDRAKDRDDEDKLWVTSQNESGVGAELTVAKDEAGAVAGAAIGERTVGQRTVGQRTEVADRDGDGRDIEAEAQNQLKKEKGSGKPVALTAGTVGQIAKFTSSTDLGNSVITEVNGNVGIGTSSPLSKLTVQVGGYGLTHTSGAVTLGTFVTTAAGGAGWFGTKSNHPLNFFTNDGLARMTIDTNGNVGIGVSPVTKLHVLNTTGGASAIFGESGTGPGVYGKSTSSRGVYGESNSFIGVWGKSVSNSGVLGETAVSSLTAAGVRGVGTGSGSIGVIGESNLDNAVGVYGVSASPAGFGGYFRNTGGGKSLIAEGAVSMGTLEIIGGSDFAENFDMSAGNSSPSEIRLGMVVVIDPANPGKLNLSRQAYDRRVAGVISGAGGVKPGMTMGQEKTLADGKYPVALSGRVYVWVDASRGGAIHPGDLLTTSATPGHAMKAGNPAKAQGAIIGKAMTGLKSGKGLVLALATLQ